MKDGNEAHYLSPVRNVVGRIALTELAVDYIVSSFAHAGEASADQVVYHGNAFRSDAERCIRQEDIVVDESRTLTYFNKDILAHHAALELHCEVGALVGIKEVLRDPRALSFPVTPDSHGAVVDDVAPDGDVDRSMHLDA